MAFYEDYGLKGRGAIVTGAGTGIGRACALELAKAGAKVALFGRRAAPLEEAAAECRQYTDSVLPMSVDVSREEDVKEAVAKVLERFGRIDVLVNNAGIEADIEYGHSFDEIFEKIPPEQYLSFFEVHALGHYLMNLAVIPAMEAQQFGRIVNITSVTGVNGVYSNPGYTGSKAAAICQTKAFARRYGKYNITANSIAPGMTHTPMKVASPPEEYDAVARMTPLGHVAEPIEIARVAMFFAQEHLFVSGQNLIVDGGATIV